MEWDVAGRNVPILYLIGFSCRVVRTSWCILGHCLFSRFSDSYICVLHGSVECQTGLVLALCNNGNLFLGLPSCFPKQCLFFLCTSRSKSALAFCTRIPHGQNPYRGSCVPLEIKGMEEALRELLVCIYLGLILSSPV